MAFLVTGCAGFIGAALTERLLREQLSVVGVDHLGEPHAGLKKERLARLLKRPRFSFRQLDLTDPAACQRLFGKQGFAGVIHLAARPGVRASVDEPGETVQANLVAFAQVLEGCRRTAVPHLVYASSSAVYGANPRLPLDEKLRTCSPSSLYAATKAANELMAHSYSHLFGLPCTGLRFFTVYGPWGRPDMAVALFTAQILRGEPLQVFNGGMVRDFTYVDDVVEGLFRVMQSPPNAHADKPPYAIYNLGNGRRVPVAELVRLLETLLGIRATQQRVPASRADVPATEAATEAFAHAFGFRPRVRLVDGLRSYVAWYRSRLASNPGFAVVRTVPAEMAEDRS